MGDAVTKVTCFEKYLCCQMGQSLTRNVRDMVLLELAFQCIDAVAQHGQSAPLAVPQLGSCASSGRAWHAALAGLALPREGPLGACSLPQVLELAASKADDSTAFDHSGGARLHRGR